MPESLVEEAFHLYVENLYIAVPMLAAVVVTAVASALAALATYASLSGVFATLRGSGLATGVILAPFAVVLLLVALVFAFVAVAANTVAGGVVAELALGLVGGRRLELGEAWERVKPRVVTLLVAALLAGVVTLLLALVPVVGLAAAETLFTPLPLLVVAGRGALDSLSGSFDVVVESLSRRAEVPLVVFVIYLVGAAHHVLGLLVSLLGYPYAILLYALYMKEEGLI